MAPTSDSDGRRQVLQVLPVLALCGLLIASLVGVHAWGERQTPNPPADSDADEREYRSIVIFRNDDLQPNYRVETMRAVDRVFIEEGVPVTQAVIPTVDGDSVARYPEFCNYLRERKRAHPTLFEFSLHGYDHRSVTEFYGGSEFGGTSYDSQRERIVAGKRSIADCVGTEPETFVPPFNTYDNATVRALAAENITVVSGGAWFTDAYYQRSSVFVTEESLHVPNTQAFVENWSTGTFYTEAELRESFDRAYDNGDVYVQMLHYQTFSDGERLDRLRSFVRYVDGHDDVRVVTLAEFGAAYREGRLTRTEDGWTYRPPDPDPEGEGRSGSLLDSLYSRTFEAKAEYALTVAA